MNAIGGGANRSATSFYQLTVELYDRLSSIDVLAPFLEVEYLEQIGSPPDTFNDPVASLWNVFRAGTILCELVNLADLDKKAPVNPAATLANLKACKINIYHFRVACAKIISDQDIFTINELTKDDTNGYVKVIKTVALVLDYLEEKGFANTKNPKEHRFRNAATSADPTDHRAMIVREMLNTERVYIRDLEQLQMYQKEVQSKQLLPPEKMVNIFANIRDLVDFQRKFLVGVEAQAHRPPDQQMFGNVFVQYEEQFSCYGPFCANFDRASELFRSEKPFLEQHLPGIGDPGYGLESLLIKPVQRITKYPLLMNELIKKTDKSAPNYKDLEAGMEAVKRVTGYVNEVRRKMENQFKAEELITRVKDWKDYSVANFGDLLHDDKFIMSTNEVEREMEVFLFERILICCKEVPGKKKDVKKKSPLQLKGRIYMNSVSSVEALHLDDGTPIVKVNWYDGQPGSFLLKCRNDEMMNRWTSAMEKIVAANPMSPTSPGGRGAGGTFMSQDDEEEEDSWDPERFAAPGMTIVSPPPPRMRNRSEADITAPLQGRTFGRVNGSTMSMQLPPAPRTASVPGRSSSHPSVHSMGPPPHGVTSYGHAQPGSGRNLSVGTTSALMGAKPTGLVKVRINYMDDEYNILVSNKIMYQEFLGKLEKKIRLCSRKPPAGPESLRVRYQDEDGDYVTIKTDEDLQTSMEGRDSSLPSSTLEVFVNEI